MDAACSKCGKDLAAFLGDDFTSILVERKRAVVNSGSSQPSAESTREEGPGDMHRVKSHGTGRKDEKRDGRIADGARPATME